MATIGINMMPEVPRASSATGSGAHSSHRGALAIPNFDDASYDTWVSARLVAAGVAARMKAYEANMGPVKQAPWRKALISAFTGMEESALCSEEHTFHWGRAPKKGKKVAWTDDVDVGRCKPGPLKSYVEYDPEVAGV